MSAEVLTSSLPAIGGAGATGGSGKPLGSPPSRHGAGGTGHNHGGTHHAHTGKQAKPGASTQGVPTSYLSTQNVGAIPKSLHKIFRRPIVGDLFSNNTGTESSLLGLMYRSRVEMKKATDVQKNSINAVKYGGDISLTGSTAEISDFADSGDDSDDDRVETMSSKQQLAVTIRNWSMMPENDEHIIREGAAHALIALAGIEDPMIRKCCAVALYNLSSRPANRNELISLGAATGAITLTMSVKSWYVETNHTLHCTVLHLIQITS
jgi:hypothetical protein